MLYIIKKNLSEVTIFVLNTSNLILTVINKKLQNTVDEMCIQ